VSIAALFLLSLFIAVMAGSGSLGDRFPGRVLMLLVHNWSFLSVTLKAVPALLTIGISIFANYKLRDLPFYLIVSVSVVGILAAVYLILEVSSVDTARRFWAYSPVASLEDYQSFVSAAQTGLGALAAWLFVVLGIQLGVKKGAEGQ
jgi:hypothetical protein